MQQLRKNKYLGLTLALSIFFGQAVSVLHAHNLDEHSSNEPCPVCLHIQGHDGVETLNVKLLKVDYRLVDLSKHIDSLNIQNYLAKPYHSQAPPALS